MVSVLLRVVLHEVDMIIVRLDRIDERWWYLFESSIVIEEHYGMRFLIFESERFLQWVSEKNKTSKRVRIMEYGIMDYGIMD